MSAREENVAFKDWTTFLLVTAVAAFFWDSLCFGFERALFSFARIVPPSILMLALLMLIPFVASLAIAYLVVWRTQRSIITKVLSNFAAAAAVFGMAFVTGHLFAFLFPVSLVWPE